MVWLCFLLLIFVCVLCLLTCHTALLTAKRQGCGTFASHSLSPLRRFWKRKMEASTRNSFTLDYTFHKNPPTKLINRTAQKIEPPPELGVTPLLSLSIFHSLVQQNHSRKRTRQSQNLALSLLEKGQISHINYGRVRGAPGIVIASHRTQFTSIDTKHAARS